MIILLCGEDSYRINERFRGLVLAFEKKYDPSGLNILRLIGETAEAGDIREALRSAGFLGSKRLVTIADLFASGRAKEFFDILNAPKDYDDSVLILTEYLSVRELEKDSIFKKLDKKFFKLEEYCLLRGFEINLWIKNEFKKNNAAAEPAAIAALARAVGGDLWLMKQEIMKLSAYARGRAVVANDVKTLLSIASEDNIFEFLDAVSSKDAKGAAAMMHRELAANGPPLVLYQLIRLFKTMFMVLDARERQAGLDAQALAKLIDAHPFVVKKALESLNYFTKEELKSILNRLFYLDKSIKTGAKNEIVAFDLFLSDLLRNPANPA